MVIKIARWLYRLSKIGIFIWALVAWSTTLSSTGSPRDAFLTLFVFAMIDIGVFLYDIHWGDYDLLSLDMGIMAFCKFLQIFIFIWVVKSGYAGEFPNFVFLFWSGGLDIYIFVEKLRFRS